MCGEYLSHIRKTKATLYRYIQENPTREEARKVLPNLIKAFKKNLNEEQLSLKSSDDKDVAMMDKIDENTDASTEIDVSENECTDEDR